MNWAMPSGIRSKIATAAAMGALATISALSAPAQAFAAPTPSHAPADSAIGANKLTAQLTLPVDYRGGSDNDDDDGMYYDY
jgi:hypothetical protein